MKHFSHLNSAAEIIRLYKGEEPFYHFIKEFFRQHKKYGSKDRKRVSGLCYSYFRLGNSFPGLATEERILAGLFLCSVNPDELLENLRPEWNAAIREPLGEKCVIAGLSYDELAVFPFTDQLSAGIEKEPFVLSHLQQPGLFIRVRPGYEKQVLHQLDEAGETYKRIDNSCIAFPNVAKIDGLLQLNKEAVIQDYSSQRVGELLAMARERENVHTVWDCCAASGGKSILAKDILGDIQLTVSDVRKSILANLEKRFEEAEITNYTSRVEDLALERRGKAETQTNRDRAVFDCIIADVPCTGSGTWGRTPESLSWFKEDAIDRYQALQKQITTNAVTRLKKGGCFLYITCSVFKKENEDMAAFIKETLHLKLLRMETLKGYMLRADTMFAALFVNSDQER
ncbi:MAG TPA: Fmu (Sun) domain-containing protein [Chitinophagaceae bacterium]